jgi:hypothetical protein
MLKTLAVASVVGILVPIVRRHCEQYQRAQHALLEKHKRRGKPILNAAYQCRMLTELYSALMRFVHLQVPSQVNLSAVWDKGRTARSSRSSEAAQRSCFF